MLGLLIKVLQILTSEYTFKTSCHELLCFTSNERLITVDRKHKATVEVVLYPAHNVQ